MALTRKGFQGKSAKDNETEERAAWSPGKGGYPDPATDAGAFMSNLPATQGQNSKASKGLPGGLTGPSAAETPPPRHNFSLPGGDGVVGQGNSASTGLDGPLPKGPANTPGPAGTGAGKGKKVVKQYGPAQKSFGGPSGLTQGSGALGRNTAK